MLLDRKDLPGILKLPYKFDITKMLQAFEAFSDIHLYNDLDGQNAGAEYSLLCQKKRELHEKFVSTEEKIIDSNLGLKSREYRQLALTEFDLNLDSGREIPVARGEVSKHKRAILKSSPFYDPRLDERNYTRRKKFDGYFNDVLDTFKSQVTRTRFAYLAPGHSIEPHRDYNTTYSIRVHIPIVTNDKSFLCFRDHNGDVKKIHCPANGEAYFFNTGLEHWAENHGNSGRVHLIISINGQEDLGFYSTTQARGKF